ncbi:MAG: repeat-containing protein [Ignavibacteria bacterium]|nr:repeat-containing protein [Ignavibacteria bacterium]
MKQTIIILALLTFNLVAFAQVNSADYRYDNQCRLTYYKQNVIEASYFYDNLGNRATKSVIGLPLVTGLLPSTDLCAGQWIDVDFTINPIFSGLNVFSAQLSDANGSFANPTVIGSLSGNIAGTIRCFIPKNTPTGNKYRIRVVSTNPAMNGTDNMFDITISPISSSPIIGSSTACANSVNSYSTATPANVTNLWEVTNGSIVGSSTGNAVSIRWSSQPTGQVRLIQTTLLGCVDTNKLDVTIIEMPSVVIYGPTSVCFNNTYSYYSPKLTGFNMTWIVWGGVFIGPTNDTVVSVRWTTSNPSATIGLIQSGIANGCRDTARLVVQVNPLPKPTISGNIVVCAKTQNTYTSNLTNDTIKWVVQGGVIVSLDNQRTVDVVWGLTSPGVVKLIQTNSFGCKDSAILNVQINPVPTPQIIGDTDVCQKERVVYHSNGTPAMRHLWTVTNGSVLGASTLDSVIVNWSSTMTQGALKLVQTYISSGCKDSITKIITINPIPVPVISGKSGSCEGASDVFISVNNSVDIQNDWSVTSGTITVDNGTSITVLWNTAGPGTVKLKQTNINTGCADSVTMNVTVNPIPKAIIFGDTIVCENTVYYYYTNRIPQVRSYWVVEGGTPISSTVSDTILVRWNKVTIGSIRLVRTYNLTGCTDSTQKTITILPQPKPIIFGDTSVCARATEVYRTPIFNGTYRWWVRNGSIIGSTITDSVVVSWGATNSATLTLVLVGINGCTDSLVQKITINPLPNPVILGNSSVCARAGYDYTSAVTLNMANQWRVLKGTILGTSTGSTVRIMWDSAGRDTIILIQTNTITGCVDSAIKIVNINPTPVANIIGDPNACKNNAHIYQSLVNFMEYNRWYVTGGSIIDSTRDAITIMWGNTSPGTIKLVKINRLTGCSDSITVQINLYTKPTPSITGPTVVCQKYLVTYTSSTTTNFILWRAEGGHIVGDSTQMQVRVIWDIPDTGRLVLIHTVQTGCSDSAIYKVFINPAPVVNVTGEFIVCENKSYTYQLRYGANVRYVVSVTSGTITDSLANSITVRWGSAGTGTLKLNMIDINTSCIDSVVYVINIARDPHPAIIGPLNPCARNSYFYVAFDNVDMKDDWSVTNGAIINIYPDSVEVVWDSAGVGEIFLKQTNLAGCSDSTKLTVNVIGLPKMAIYGSSIGCVNNISKFTTDNDGTTIRWDVVNGAIIGANNLPQVDILWGSVGVGIVKLYKTSSFGCNDSLSLPIDIFPTPTPIITGVTDVCEKNNYVYSYNRTSGISNRWLITGGAIIDTSQYSEITVRWNTPGTGKLSLIQTDNKTGCSDTAEMTININPLPDVTITGPKTVCPNIEYTYFAEVQSGASYEWAAQGGSIAGSLYDTLVQVVWDNVNRGRLTLKISSSLGCKDSVTIDININPLPTANIIGPTSVCKGSTESYRTTGNPNVQISWQVLGGSILGDPTKENILVYWNTNDSGTVRLMKIDNTTGCKDSNLITVYIYAFPDLFKDLDTNGCINGSNIYELNVDPNVFFKIEEIHNGTMIDSTTDYFTINWTSFTDTWFKIVKINVNNFCMDTTVYNILVHELPIPELVGDSIVCPEFPYPFSGKNPQSTYQWVLPPGAITNDALTSNPINIIFSQSGDLRLIEISQWGCMDSVDQHVRVIDSLARIEVSYGEGQYGDTVSIPLYVYVDDTTRYNYVIAAKLYYDLTLISPVDYTFTQVNDTSAYIDIVKRLEPDSTGLWLTLKFVILQRLDTIAKLELMDIVQYDEFCIIKRDNHIKIVKDTLPYPKDEVFVFVYPNDNDGNFIIRYGTVETGISKLYLTDLIGIKIASIMNEEVTIGFHELPVSINDISSGMYFLTLETPTRTKQIKVCIVK